MAKWIVNVKGRAGAEAFEISVIRADNKHGLSSYGWFDERKLLVTHNGGPCHDHLVPRVWDGAVKLAHEVADEMNAAEALAKG